jgi:cytosine/adenosine deaminase-related metal-dependent hydrolase
MSAPARALPPHALKARWVFPVAAAPIPDGVVTLDGERIIDVGDAPAGNVPVEDLGSVALLPGLVNAHSHLDLSHLAQPLGEPGVGFVDWIRLVIEHRLETQPDRPVEQGIEQSIRCGVTTLGDIAQPAAPRTPYDTAALDCTVFLELIGLEPERITSALEAARVHVTAGRQSARWRPGVSPHAPYSVHPRLLDAVISRMARERVPLAFHLAESREELDLLGSGAGPFRELLQDMGVWTPGMIRPGTRPLDYLARLARASRALVIHGNYLDDEEIALVAEHAERMAVVYCPRTHAYFGHEPYPLEKMLTAGVPVALGTDSRASSPDLDLFAEIRAASAKHPNVPREAILRLGTLAGAVALGLQHHVGTLEPGKLANLTAVSLRPDAGGDPHDLLFDAGGEVVHRLYRGTSNAAE